MKNPLNPSYIIKRYPHGWMLCGINFEDCYSMHQETSSGVPIDALKECLPMFPQGCVVEAAVAHHYRTYCGMNVALCIGTKSGLKKWHDEINKWLDRHTTLSPEERWWCGLDVGASSEAIFAVLNKVSVPNQPKPERGSTPIDSDDLGRCLRLLKAVPSFAPQLDKVAAAYPDTAWPGIIARWSELEKATPDEQTKILKAIHEKK
jgi:hypothetical protein